MNQTQVRFLNDGTAPNAADTWMIYQALAGVWPATLSPDDAEGLKALEARFLGFLEKRCARRNSAPTGSTATRAMRAWC
jgi:(1->4)-alpha-D-glucan 1-alpha-D-glucosylmutase